MKNVESVFSVAVLFIASCSSDETGTLSGEICDTEPENGAWDPTTPTEGSPIDWSDPDDPTETPQKDGYPDLHMHHELLVAVHAAHLPAPQPASTGKLILFHGQSEERVWPIGGDASEMRWYPVTTVADPDVMTAPNLCGSGDCYADLFCSGHVVLPNGKFFVAGGNVDGDPESGGLTNMFTFDLKIADPDVAPFGWTDVGHMAVDRWYPTLTVLRNGRVLISSGTSRVVDGRNTFELYNPENNDIDLLDIDGTSPFLTDDIALYPFMFALPNGDVLYAGGEGAAPGASHGRILVPNYGGNGVDGWEWNEHVFQSDINGGSAAMYRPGVVVKTGGILTTGTLAGSSLAATESLDLSGYASNDYDSAPDEFETRTNMNHPRHYHTLTMLPDGNVLATGGNTRSNGVAGIDSYNNECDYDNVPISTIECSDLNNDGIPDDKSTMAVENGCPAVPSRCLGGSCPLQDDEDCTSDEDCGSTCAGDSECPPGSTCGPLVGMVRRCEMPCPDSASTCGAVVYCTPDGYCNPAKNECYATKTAEIWDPVCDTWTDLAEEYRPRMYHSTALLIPDGRVISMGGGHRPPSLEEQSSAQYFTPDYGLPGDSNTPVITVAGETNMMDLAPALAYNAKQW